MLLIIISVSLMCAIRESHSRVEDYKVEVQVPNVMFCLNAALKALYREQHNILFVSGPPDYLENVIIKIPHFRTNDWDKLLSSDYANFGSSIIFLEGNADIDLKNLERLRGIRMIPQILMVCVSDAVCGSEIYLTTIVDVVDSTQLHYIAMDRDGSINIYQYSAVAEGNCSEAQLLRRAKCSEKLSDDKAFRSPINFHKCPIRIVTWSCPPHTLDCGPGVPKTLCGIEGQIVEEVVKAFNATPVLTMVQNPPEVKSLIVNRQADLGYGLLDVRSFDGVSYSTPYIFVEVTVIGPHSIWASKRSLVNVLLPFEFRVWIGIGVVAASTYILRKFVPHFRRVPLLKLLGMFLGTTAATEPHGTATRIYFLWLVLFGFYLMQFYSADLTKVLSAPREQRIRTLDDLEKTDIRVVGPLAAKQKFRNDYPRIFRDFQTLTRFRTSCDNTLKDSLPFKLIEFPTYYIELYKLLEGHSTSVFYVKNTGGTLSKWKNIEPVEDKISWYPIGLVVANSSALLRPSSRVLTTLVESGYTKACETFQINTGPPPTFFGVKATTDHKATRMRLDDLYLIFLLLLVGLSISTSVLLIEFITAFVKRKLASNEHVSVIRPFRPRHPFCDRYRQVNRVLLGSGTKSPQAEGRNSLIT